MKTKPVVKKQKKASLTHEVDGEKLRGLMVQFYRGIQPDVALLSNEEQYALRVLLDNDTYNETALTDREKARRLLKARLA